MNEALKRLLDNKRLGAIVFDTDFNVVEIDKIAETILEALGQSLSERNLLQMFPEFIGSESFIREILAEKNEDHRLDYVNRDDKSGQTTFLNLIILPDDKSHRGLLVVEDTTEQARALQQINQQKHFQNPLHLCFLPITGYSTIQLIYGS